MARNIEIKARLADRVGVEARARSLATQGPEQLQQDDTFFAAASGRLKLRVQVSGDVSGNVGGQASEAFLIHYARADASGPKASDYRIARVNDPDAMRDVLARAHGLLGRVVKQRTLYLVGRTRVHLDEVRGLGSFVELEVVLAETHGLPDAQAHGTAEAHALMRALGVPAHDWVEGAYHDLLGAAAPASALAADSPVNDAPVADAPVADSPS
jgi:adenylate cyclase class IV